jgi:hypothetical protein
MKNIFNNFKTAILFVSLLCSTAASQASTVYTYQSTEYYPGGIPYEIPTSWAQPVIISFTVASPLGANLGTGNVPGSPFLSYIGYDISAQILNWTAGTGVPGDTITNSMAGTRITAANVWTNASGQIYAYNFGFFGPVVGLSSPPANELVSANKLPDQRGQDGIRFERLNGYNFGSLYTGLYSSSTVTSVNSPALGSGGSSSGTGAGTSVPVPSSILLLLAGLIGTTVRLSKKNKGIGR